MAREATLSVSLTNELKQFVRQKVDRGQFESASEVIRHSLREMQQQEEREHLYWSNVRKSVKLARAAISEGDVVGGPAFMRSKIAALKSQARNGRTPGRQKTRS